MRGLAIITVSLLLGCGSHSSEHETNTTHVAPVRPTAPKLAAATAPRRASARRDPVRRYTEKERVHMREWFSMSENVVASVADRAHGVSVGIAEHPDDEATRTYYVVPSPLKEADLTGDVKDSMPTGWDDVRSALLDALSATNNNINVLQQAHDGDADAARDAPKAAEDARDQLCSALALARHHYVSAGGRANDLGLFYLSDNTDMPCSLVDEQPVSATVVRRTVGISSFETFTGNGGQEETELNKNIIDDFGVRLRPGAKVTVVEHRRSFDEGVPLLCRADIPHTDHYYWVACRDLSVSK